MSLVIIVGVVWFLLRPDFSSKKVRNVLLISIDTCRADHLSCYGYPRKTTPNIDKMARKSILFTNVITPIPLTLPAHSSMLTGTIPPYHGIHDNFDYRLSESNVTLAEVLDQNGFTTGAIISASVLDSKFGVNQGFETYNDRFEQAIANYNISERLGGEASRFALAWLDKHKSKRFFLFLHYYDPHTPYEPPEPFASKYYGHPYVGEIAYTDYCIGQVIKKLKKLKLYDSTLIIITGDHGEMLGEHKELTHGYFIYQSAIKVPLIFKLPGRSKAKKIASPVGIIDIVPTVCRMVELEVPAQVQGRDLSGYFWEKQPSEQDGYLYCESLRPTKYNANSLLGVVTNRWKYIQTTRPELYDLTEDPHETNNLVKQHPQRARILQDQLKQILEEASHKGGFDDSKLKLDEESRRRLESLGYIAGSVREDFEFDQSKDDPKDLIDFHMLNERAIVLIAQKKYAEARKICEKMLLRENFYTDGRYHLAKIAMNTGNFSEAVFHLSEVLRLKPGESDLHNKLGFALFNLGEMEESIKHYNKALQIDPENSNAHNNLGLVLLAQGKIDQAIDCYKKALIHDPYMWKANYNLGNAYLKLGKFDKAVIECKKAIALNPNSAEAYNNLSIALSKQGKYDAAIINCRKALELEPDMQGARDSLALFVKKKEELEKTIQFWTKSLEENPNQPQLHYNLGAVFYQQDNIEKAVHHWNMALELKPDLLAALNNLAWIRITNKASKFHNPQEGLQLSQRACELTSFKEPRFLDTLAIAYAANGAFSEAVKTAQKAIDLAQSANQPQLADEIQNHLEFYKRGQPYYDSAE